MIRRIALAMFVIQAVATVSGAQPGDRGPCAVSVDIPTQPIPNAANHSLARLLRWLEVVPRHTPGCGDALAVEVGGWSRQDLEGLLRDLTELSKAFQEARELMERDPKLWIQRRDAAAAFRINPVPTANIRLHGHNFIIDPDSEFSLLWPKGNYGTHFHGSATLQRGAVLHADIAAFIPDELGQRRIFAQDGKQSASPRGTIHWEFGRKLLDAVTPNPSDDAGTLLWYRAVSAYLFSRGLLDDLPAHLARARTLFPQSPAFLIDSAYFHQMQSSPMIQAAAEDVRKRGLNVMVDSPRVELERSERFWRQALTLAPDNAEARMRLGHTLSELGRNKEAAVELRKANDGTLEGHQRYFASLFLGRVEHALGRREEARRHYQNAAALYPSAQSPRLALGWLAREAGDRSGTLRELQSMTEQGTSDRSDPWWVYYQPHSDDADALMTEMRKLGRDH